MINLEKALIKDAKDLLGLQYECFAKYYEKYGDFDGNPCKMSLTRMEFNIRYRYGYYYKIIDFISGDLIGAIFIFELDDKDVMKIAQFYIKEEFTHKGIGTLVLENIIKKHANVKTWYADTIKEEKYNYDFYHKLGFVDCDYEEEREGLTFVNLVKKQIS